MGFGAPADPSTGLRKQQQKDDAAVAQGMTDINQQFAGFDPNFYKGIENAYTRSAQPSLQQQYKTTADATGFKLAGQGLEGSSQSKTLSDNLSSTLVQAQDQVANNAIGQRQALQQDVANEKSSLIGQLEASKDPNAAAQQAREAAINLGQVPAFNAQPISNLFGTFANTYLQGQANSPQNNYSQQYYNGYNASVGGSMFPTNVFGALPSTSISTK